MFSGVLQFTVRTPGIYTVVINSTGPGQAVVAESLAVTMRKSFGLVLGTIGGGLLTCIGFG